MPIASRPNFTTGEKDCAAAMTDWTQYYPLAEAQRVGNACEIVVKARKANSGKIYIAADAYVSKIHPFRLEPNESINLRVDSPDKILVGAEVAGEGVEFIMEL